MVSPYGSVLVVDDLRMNRIVLARMVRKLGFDVLEAENGLQALDVFLRERGRCAFIFMDLVMPLKDGYTTARELRGLEKQWEADRTPIVAYTAEKHDHIINGETVYNACKNSGMDDCLSKPVSLEIIMATFRQFLPSFRAAVNTSTAHPQAQYAPCQTSCSMLQEQAREMLSRASADHVDAHNRFAAWQVSQQQAQQESQRVFGSARAFSPAEPSAFGTASPPPAVAAQFAAMLNSSRAMSLDLPGGAAPGAKRSAELLNRSSLEESGAPSKDWQPRGAGFQ